MALDSNGFYAGLRDGLASPLIQRYGFPCAIWVKSNEVFDNISGTISQAAVYGINPTFAIYGGGKSGKYPGVSTTNEGNKTLGRMKKKSIFVESSILGIVPAPEDLFQDESGLLLEILTVEATNPGGVNLLWNLTVKM